MVRFANIYTLLNKYGSLKSSLKKTYMEARPTTNMKKGWLCRNSRDEKNHEIAPMMIQWWWSSNDDPDRVMIQIQWWSRSSDDPDLVMMIQIKWWCRSEDKDDLKMKMTWRRRWLNDDPDDTTKKTCADILCRENTFLVKRECWCNCNFGMYSLVYLMYYTPMFILGCVCNVIKSCHALMFRSGVSIM